MFPQTAPTNESGFGMDSGRDLQNRGKLWAPVWWLANTPPMPKSVKIIGEMVSTQVIDSQEFRTW